MGSATHISPQPHGQVRVSVIPSRASVIATKAFFNGVTTDELAMAVRRLTIEWPWADDAPELPEGVSISPIFEGCCFDEIGLAMDCLCDELESGSLNAEQAAAAALFVGISTPEQADSVLGSLRRGLMPDSDKIARWNALGEFTVDQALTFITTVSAAAKRPETVNTEH